MSRKKKTTQTKAPKTTAPEVQAPAPDTREWVARAADLRILGRIQAGTEDEALAAAKEQFDGAETVEPTLAEQDLGVQALAPEEAPTEQPTGDAPVEQATPDMPTESADASVAEPQATSDDTSDKPRILTREELGLPMPSTGKQDAPPHASKVDAIATADDGAAPPAKKKRTRATKPAAQPEKKLSALDAAARVLGETGQAMSCQELILAMAEKGYWISPAGKTPAATLYAAMLRETQTKGSASRFIKADRGKFALRASE